MTTTIDTGITEGDLLTALVRELQQSTRLPGDVTRDELQQAAGCGREKASKFLQAKVRAGELVCLRVQDDGRQVYVYRKRNGAPGTQTGSA